jgi:uncharacterized protein
VLGRLTFLALMLIASAARAQAPVFDLHVHLWKGEASLREYEAQLKAAGQEVTAFGAMWFGGPNQALQGEPGQIRANNDGLIALAARYPKLMPIATVHPYDGAAAVAELERIGARRQGSQTASSYPEVRRG